MDETPTLTRNRHTPLTRRQRSDLFLTRVLVLAWGMKGYKKRSRAPRRRVHRCRCARAHA